MHATRIVSGCFRRESRDLGEGPPVERDGGRRIEVRRCGGDEGEYRSVWRPIVTVMLGVIDRSRIGVLLS